MKRLSILAAVVAVAAFATTGTTFAKPYTLTTDELKVCLLLELAHESSCAEYEAKLIAEHAATATPSDEVTGSIERPVAESLTR